MTHHIAAFLADWTSAEREGDTGTLAHLLTADFCGVGPLGFVLPRPAWLDRDGHGLRYEEFSLDEVEIHPYGDVAVVTARINARGTYQGQPLPEALRATLVITSDSGRSRLAVVHMSFIAGTPGSPTLGVPAQPAESGTHARVGGEGP
jgi:ketosteroid isomerase-like protein